MSGQEHPAAQTCELGGCKFLPLCASCEQEEIMAATKHLRDPSVYSPLAARWGLAGQFPPPEIEAYIEQLLADVGGSSSSLMPGAGDATQGAKDAEPGTASDSPPSSAATTEEGTMTVGRYDDNTWAVYDANGKVLASGFFTSQAAHDWIEAK